MNSKIFFSISVKIVIGILMDVALPLEIALVNMGILTIVAPMNLELRRSLQFVFFCLFY